MYRRRWYWGLWFFPLNLNQVSYVTRAGNWDWAQMAQKSLAHTQVGIYRRYFHSCRSRRYIALFGAVFLYSFGTGNTTDNIFFFKRIPQIINGCWFCIASWLAKHLAGTTGKQVKGMLACCIVWGGCLAASREGLLRQSCSFPALGNACQQKERLKIER